MQREDLDGFKAWFTGYVRGFYGADEDSGGGIRFKEGHTERVCRNMIGIGRSLGLGEEDLLLAETVALFHDLGRFKQYAVYRTFNDRWSENHALLGVRVLEETGVISGLDREDQELITSAVRCHNLPDLPPELEGRGLLLARLIRDADKLDILGVFTGNIQKPEGEYGLILESGLPGGAGYSPSLAESLLQGKRCVYDEMKNRNDRKLLMLSWVYDINFPYTLREIDQRGYLKILTASLPGDEVIREIGGRIGEYVAARLAGSIT